MILVIGVTVFLLWKKPAAQPVQQQANVEMKIQDPAPEPIRIIPKIQDGNPAMKKSGIGIVSNIRGAAYRTERKRSELKQIGLAYNQYSDEEGARQPQLQRRFWTTSRRSAKFATTSRKVTTRSISAPASNTTA